MPPERPAIPALDGLRGVAALLVAAYHAWLLSGEARLDGGPARDALSSGHFAVSFFFVLSGFVLFWPVALGSGLGPLGGYLRRRVARIVPAYYVALGLGAALFGLLVAGPATLGDRVTPGSLAAHLLLVHNEARLLPGYEGALGFGVNPALWTLSVEWWFYLALPLVAAPFARRPWAWVAGAAVVAVGGRLALTHGDLGLSARTSALLLSSAPLHAVDFAAGMAAAVVVAGRAGRLGATPRAGTVAVGAFMVVVILMVVAGGPDGAAARAAARESVGLALAVPAAFAVLAAALALAPRTPLGGRAGRFLGEVSYGVFLSHFLLIGLARATLDFRLDGSWRAFLAMEAFVLVGAVAYGALSWRLVEAPARRWARRAGSLSSSRTPRSSASPPREPSPDRAPG